MYVGAAGEGVADDHGVVLCRVEGVGDRHVVEGDSAVEREGGESGVLLLEVVGSCKGWRRAVDGGGSGCGLLWAGRWM